MGRVYPGIHTLNVKVCILGLCSWTCRQSVLASECQGSLEAGIWEGNGASALSSVRNLVLPVTRMSLEVDLPSSASSQELSLSTED